MTQSGVFSHCSHWGAYRVHVRDGRITEVVPHKEDPHPSPLIQSIRGWTDTDRRILAPMVRRSWLENRETSRGEDRGREAFVPVSWEHATALVAGEIDRVRRDHDNPSIFAGSYGWTSCGRLHHASSLLKRMLNLVGGFTDHRDTYSVAAGPVILRHVLGSNAACNGAGTTLDSVAEHCETLIVFGALSPRTAQNEAGGIARHTLEIHLRRLAERGVRVVLVSPSRDDLPDWVDAEWWPVRPNTDTALMLGLAGEIVKAGWHDIAFLSTRCSGADRFLDYLTGAADGIVKDAAWAAAITGLEADRIRALLPAMRGRRVMLSVSWSLQRARFGEQPYWAALGLAAILGQIGLPGGGVGYGYGSLGGVGTTFGVGTAPAISKLDNPTGSFIPVARIGDLLLHPGETFDYEGQSHVYPDIRLVYWAGGNPYHHHQDLNRLERAWARPETIIVQDPMWTATAQRADIVLPASSSLERNDIAGNRRCDRMIAMHKVIDPIGDARSDLDIFAAISKRLGVGDAFDEGRDEMGWLRHIYEGCRRDAQDRQGFEMPDFDRFWELGSVPVPVLEHQVYLAGFRDDPDAHPLDTESGRIVLGSDTLAALGYDDCPAHPTWLHPEEWRGEQPPRDSGLFQLISPQPRGRLHSQLESEPASTRDKRNGREQVAMHPDDAAPLGIAAGSLVRIGNDRGACLAAVRLTRDIRPGVASLPTGAWLMRAGNDPTLEVSGNPNVVTRDIGSSRFGQGCAAHTCVVRITPEPDAHPDPQERYLAHTRTLAGTGRAPRA